MNHKHHQSERIRRQIEEYLARGGRVRQIPPGVSGRDHPDAALPFRNPVFLPRSSQPRTPVPEVVAAIEARRQAALAARRPAARRLRARTGPRRRLVYDDFGEPLRWEWVND